MLIGISGSKQVRSWSQTTRLTSSSVASGRQLRRAQRLLADRVAIGARDAEQVALDVDREAAAERLRDVADAARRAA